MWNDGILLQHYVASWPRRPCVMVYFKGLSENLAGVTEVHITENPECTESQNQNLPNMK